MRSSRADVSSRPRAHAPEAPIANIKGFHDFHDYPGGPPVRSSRADVSSRPRAHAPAAPLTGWVKGCLGWTIMTNQVAARAEQARGRVQQVSRALACGAAYCVG